VNGNLKWLGILPRGANAKQSAFPKRLDRERRAAHGEAKSASAR
jgi:hypothetical protein